ncbi:MAG TPA: TIM-barrel domain-containing protein [Verrucomicrobiae bacterium]
MLKYLLFLILAAQTATVHAEQERGTINEVEPGIWRIRFGTPEKFTPVSLRESDPQTNGFKTLPQSSPPFDLDSIRCRVASSRTVVNVPCNEPGDEIYGFGLDPGAYKQKGLAKNLTVCAAVMEKTGASHGPVPFYLSTKGYGVFVDTARVANVQVARLTPNQSATASTSSNDQPATSEASLYAGRPATGKSEVVFDLPGDSSGVDVYVFGGPTMREAVQRYNLFSGGGAVPPLWGLGLKFRTYTRADESNVVATATALRQMQIPADMLGLEPGWQSAAYSCTYTWSKERFPDPQAMTQRLRAQGFKLNLWEHAYVRPSSPLYPPLQKKAGDYLVWGGLVIDFADPQAREIFARYHDEALVSQGILGFKGDECDRQPPTDATPFNFPYCSVFPSGIDGDQMTQMYGYLYQRTLEMPFRAHNLRTWSDIRATTALAAPLPFNLYSDAYQFDQYLRQLVNASFTGLLWSPEVRQATSPQELFNRVAMSAFAPQMCLNMWFLPHPVWEQYDRGRNEANKLLSSDEQQQIAAHLREIVNQRYSLIPYLYASFQRYRNEGLPPVRSLLLDFPKDHALRTIDDEFLFGDSILVAPFLGETTSRKVVLPKGTDWFDCTGRAWRKGGATVTVTGQAGAIPLFVKTNSIVPVATPVQHIEKDTVFNLTVEVFGEHPPPFTLFEDDGETYDFEHGAMNKVELSWQDGKGTSHREGSYPGRRYSIDRWRNVAAGQPAL